ncbi:unnamed protein product [Sphagnum balticum]
MAAAVASQAVAAMASVAGILVSLASSSSSQVARLQLTTPAAPSSFGIGRCHLLTRSSATSDFGSTAPKRHAVSKNATNAIATKEAGTSSATRTGGHELLLFKALREGLEEELDRDPTVCVIGEDVGHCGGSYKVTKAAKTLVNKGYDPEIIDIRSLKPFDMYTIGQSVKRTHQVLIVDECMQTGGIGASLRAAIMENFFAELDAPICCLSSQDVATPYSGPLEELTIVQPPQIVAAVEQLCMRG